MSLIDALLLDPYRDPREVWIAVRSDGAAGSGTIDDPFDGGRRAGEVLRATSILDRQTVVCTTLNDHPYNSGTTIALFGVSRLGASVFNRDFSIELHLNSPCK